MDNQMDNQICRHCGGRTLGDGDTHCPDCTMLFQRRKRKRLLLSGMAVLLFLGAGFLFWHADLDIGDVSWDALTGKPAAVINGEPIARGDLKARMKVSRIMLERQYGKDLFTGERGRATLAALEEDILERILQERLVAQEARRMGIQVSDEEVRRELERIGRDIYGNVETFQTSLREDGISQEYLLNHIRFLLFCQEIKKLKFASQADSDTRFGVWMGQARAGASVAVYRQDNQSQNASLGRDTCCGSGGGGCGGRGGGGCGTKQAGPLDPELESKAGAAALAEYRKKNPAEKKVEARVTDYGCHIQVDIEKEGRVVKSYAYQDGNVIDN